MTQPVDRLLEAIEFREDKTQLFGHRDSIDCHDHLHEVLPHSTGGFLELRIGLIALECYEGFRQVSALRIGGLHVNLAIVFYLIKQLKQHT